MSFSTKSNPKLAQSGVALTSLGAVGGARGTAAGGLRILVEFLTTYDPNAIKELEEDLADVETKSKLIASTDEARLKKLAAVRKQIANADRSLKAKQNSDIKTEIKLQDLLQGTRTRAGKAQLAASEANLVKLLKTQNFTRNEIRDIRARYDLRRQESVLDARAEAADERRVARQRQRAATEVQISKARQVRESLGPRLAGLAIGAVGGIVGGAVLGLGFAAAEKGLEVIGDKLQDLIDPARHAREQVEGLAKAINSVADAKQITQLQAAQEFLAKAGVPATPGSPGGGPDLAGLLAENAARQLAIDQINQLNEARNLAANWATIEKEQIQKLAEKLVDQAKIDGNLKDIYAQRSSGRSTALVLIRQEIDGVDALTLAEQQLTGVTDEYTDSAYRAAEAAMYTATAAERAAAILSIAAENIANAIGAAGARQSDALGAQMDALGEGTSPRTRKLQKRLDASTGAKKGPDQERLRNIAEERALLLLKMRLRLLGTNINLEKYAGKFLMVAIEAKISALQREGEELHKINRLLDLQYRMSQTIRRQEGESIQEFLERRAQEQRNQLTEQADIERENQIQRLEDRKTVLADEIALQELANQRREALRANDTANANDNLRKQLEASKKADAKALAARKKALADQQKEKEKANAELAKLSTDAAIAETSAAIKGIDSLQKLNTVGGRIAGYKRAKATLQALVEGFGLPASVAAPLLTRINSLISAYQAQFDRIHAGAFSKPGGTFVASAKGGVFNLNNSKTPFGQNVRVGEEGSEIGVVLSHNVAKILQAQKPSAQQIGPFIIQQSNDPFKDKYAFGKLVEKSVEAALG